MCHMSHVTCHVSHVKCHMSHVTFFLFFSFSFLPSPPKKKYWSYDPHRSRDLVPPIWEIFFLAVKQRLFIFSLRIIFLSKWTTKWLDKQNKKKLWQTNKKYLDKPTTDKKKHRTKKIGQKWTNEHYHQIDKSRFTELHSYRATKLQSYRVTELQSYHVRELHLQSYIVTEFRIYRVTELQSYRKQELQIYRVTKLQS